MTFDEFELHIHLLGYTDKEEILPSVHSEDGYKYAYYPTDSTLSPYGITIDSGKDTATLHTNKKILWNLNFERALQLLKEGNL